MGLTAKPCLSARDEQWVTKTDIIRFRACPYAFFLVDRGYVSLEQLGGEFNNELIQAGRDFERTVRASAVPLPIPSELTYDVLPTLFSKPCVLFGLPMLENVKLKIYGKPDGVKTEGGKLIPIEIKSHASVRREDRLELAFYHTLLEPYRTMRSEPRGMLILRTAFGEEQIVIELREQDFEVVRGLVKDVRRARRDGVTPRVCACEVCATRPEVDEYIRERKGTTLIYGVRASRARALANLGISSLEHIRDCDPESVSRDLRPHRHFVSESTVRSWKHHAASYFSEGPVLFGQTPLDFSSFIAVDLEYIAAEPGWIYLIGLSLVTESRTNILQWWGNGPAEIRANLRRLGDQIAQHPNLPVVTWAGGSAEIPELKKAADRYGLDDVLQAFLDRHLDMFHYAERNVRLPIPTLDLKKVSAFFGVPRRSTINGGMEAEALYRRFKSSRSRAARSRIKESLLEYNGDDLRAVSEITYRMRKLSAEARGENVAIEP
ncbi:MAG TPA: ribonuclease H-like domain-containing protein [Candidatus Cybelea sp.]|jgi:predicted RecB family nuclease